MKIHIPILFALILTIIPTSWGASGSAVARNKWLQQELKLSPDQRESIKKILGKYKVELDTLKKEADERKKHLRLSFRNPKKFAVSDETLLHVHDLYRDKYNQYRRTRFLMALEIRKILTPDQLLILNSLK